MPDTPQDHIYLSTGCFHGDHDYCKSMTGLNGAKRPAECKKCGAKCICLCHQEQPAPAAIPHQEPETDANGWTLEADGIWTLPVGGGTVLMSRQTTPEERARFAEQWSHDTKTKPDDADVDEPLPATCADCAAGAHDPNYHRRLRGLPPPRIVPAEHCGHLPPHTSLTAPPSECVLRPGHQGSHADDRGCRWWPAPEAVDWRQRAQKAQHRRDVLATTLEEVLRHFVHKGHPGEPCLQTGWISVKTVDRWRAIAYPTKEGHQ